MGLKEEQAQLDGGRNKEMNLVSSINRQNSSISSSSTDKDAGVLLCRVCHCVESDQRGDVALGFLDITLPIQELPEINDVRNSSDNITRKFSEEDETNSKKCARDPQFVEFISPEGEVFICSADIESGSYCNQDSLIDLGCSCKNDLSLAHYACALKWFVSHGSTICEICGSLAKNVRIEDVKKVVASLKDYDALRERTATGEVTPLHLGANIGVDPDALAGIRRQRLSEISLWFNPHNTSVTVIQEPMEQMPTSPNNNATENVVDTDHSRTKWALEGTGVLVATGLLTVTLAWLIAPRVGKVCFNSACFCMFSLTMYSLLYMKLFTRSCIFLLSLLFSVV